MNKSIKETLITTLINHKVYGFSKLIRTYQIESDKRKLKKALRELVESGYLSQTGTDYSVTEKIWDEIEPESLNLIEIWDESRKDSHWNDNKHFPFVRFNYLTNGQKKTAISTAGYLNWSVCYEVPLNYTGYKLQEGDIQGPVEKPDEYLGRKISELMTAGTIELAKQKRSGSYAHFEVILSKNGLVDHVNKTLADEKFNRLYSTNLKWGLSTFEIVSSEEAKDIVTADEPDWVFGGGGSNFGTDPSKWNEKLDSMIENATGAIERFQKRLRIMQDIKAGIEKFGGWDKFREEMAAKLKEELAKS